MGRFLGSLSIGTSVLFLAFAPMAAAQDPGTVIVPESSVEHAADIGVRAHTNVRFMVPAGGLSAAEPAVSSSAGGPPFPGYFYETPASLACVYDLYLPGCSPWDPRCAAPGVSDQVTLPDCNPNTTTVNPVGGSKVIAIVDAFHDPTAAMDLQRFSKQFGLPKAKFSVVFATGLRPIVDPTGGWELEESLDIEWVHAMAPDAKIFLVEARSNTLGDLLQAENVASKLVATHGGGEVENGWGGTEFFGESYFDSHFAKNKVVYVAAAGDSPGTEYPASSPNVVAAGGTSISRDTLTGSFLGESAWQLTGGGPSAFEAIPSYQSVISSIVGPARGTPDISLDADPNSGAWVYDSNPTGGVKGWFIVGGTSLSSAALTGIINAAGNFYTSTNAELTVVYSNLGNASDFRDIIAGTCGPYLGYSAVVGWDFCTGVGSDF
ncbi:MAG: S53 family peptidase, partial [Candidatus Binataceae bacterium]